jgi:putative inorganic carbon (hco3(-)) transporter
VKFFSDPDAKYLLLGIALGIISFFSGQIQLSLLILSLLILVLAWYRYEILLLFPPFFVLIDYAIKTAGSGVGGWWDEALLILLFVFLFFHKARNKQLSFHLTSISYPVLLFVFFGLISISLSTEVTLSQGIEGIRSVVQSFLFFLIFLNAPLSKKHNRGLLLLILSAGAITALYGLYQYAVGVPNPPHWLDKDLEIGLSRAFSFLGSPNAFAAYGVLLLPLSLAFMLKKTYRWHHRALFAAFSLLLAAGIFSSLTRAAWVALLPALVLFGVLIKKTRLMLGLLLILLIMASLSSPIRTRFLNLFSDQYQQKSEMGGRNYRWNLAWSIFDQSPLFGRGPGSYGGAVAYRAQAFQGLYVDNYYLQILSNFGFLGFLAFLWIIIEIIRNLILSAKFAQEHDKIIIYGILCGVLAFLIHNVTENLIEVIPLSVVFWVLTGLACQLSYQERV